MERISFKRSHCFYLHEYGIRYNSNRCICYKVAFYRYMSNIDMYSNINSSIKLLSASNFRLYYY